MPKATHQRLEFAVALAGAGLLAVFLLMSRSASKTAASVFPDVPSTHPYAAAIEAMGQAGVFTGRPNGTFGPYETINRAEIVEIIFRARGGQSTLCLSAPFPDVPEDAWFAPSVCAATTEGTVAGYPNGFFLPGRSVTFAEFARIVAGAFHLPMGPESDPWYIRYVSALQAKGALPPSIRDLGQHPMRGEVAFVLYKVMSLQTPATHAGPVGPQAPGQMGDFDVPTSVAPVPAPPVTAPAPVVQPSSMAAPAQEPVVAPQATSAPAPTPSPVPAPSSAPKPVVAPKPVAPPVVTPTPTNPFPNPATPPGLPPVQTPQPVNTPAPGPVTPVQPVVPVIVKPVIPAPVIPAGPVCGNRNSEGTEACDDGNTTAGDGCNAMCAVETGFDCGRAQPSICRRTSVCGDKILERATEKCDDGNTANGDGCSGKCVIESGFSCISAPSICVAGATCGDGIQEGTEECDRGGANGSTGTRCTASCKTVPLAAGASELGTEQLTATNTKNQSAMIQTLRYPTNPVYAAAFNGTAWSQPRKVLEKTNSWSPYLPVALSLGDEGESVAVFAATDGKSFHVMQFNAFKQDQGATIYPLVTVPNGETAFPWVQFSYDARGNMVLIFQTVSRLAGQTTNVQGGALENQVYVEYISATDRSKNKETKPQRIAGTRMGGRMSAAVGPNGHAFVSWIEEMPTGSQQYNRGMYSTGNGVWQEPATLAENRMNFSEPARAAVDAAGKVTAVWSDDTECKDATGRSIATSTATFLQQYNGQSWSAPIGGCLFGHALIGSGAPSAIVKVDNAGRITLKSKVPGSETAMNSVSYDPARAAAGWVPVTGNP